MVDKTKPWYLRDDSSISSHGDLNLSSLKPCSLEKAITRVLLQVKYMAKQGHRKIAVLTVGTDVLVLTVSVYEESKMVLKNCGLTSVLERTENMLHSGNLSTHR